MKLIDILVQELPKHGGWIKGHYQCAQDKSGEVCFYTKGKIHLIRYGMWSIPCGSEATHDGESRVVTSLADDYAETIITREQYEAALAASKPEWDGEGLPPVGCECMVRGEIGDDGWYECKVIAHTFFDGYNCAVFQTESTVSCSSEGNFRPIRSEADKKKEEAIKAIFDTLAQYDNLKGCHTYEGKADYMFSAIAAGKIPHISID